MELVVHYTEVTSTAARKKKNIFVVYSANRRDFLRVLTHHTYSIITRRQDDTVPHDHLPF